MRTLRLGGENLLESAGTKGQGADLVGFAERRERLAVEGDVERGGVAGFEDEMVRGAKLAALAGMKREVEHGDPVGRGRDPDLGGGVDIERDGVGGGGGLARIVW